MDDSRTGVAGSAAILLKSSRCGHIGAGADANGSARDQSPTRHGGPHQTDDFALAVLLLLIVLGLSAAVIFFFPAGRYRIPIVPLLAVLAAGGISCLAAAARRRRYRELLVPSVLLLATGFVSNAGLPAMSRDFNSDAHTDLGFSHQERGELDQARREYEIALRIDPNNMEATNNLGTILLLQGETADAQGRFLRVLESYPDDRKALVNLGTIHLRKGEPYWAGHYFLLARRSDPAASKAAEGLQFATQMAERLEEREMRADPEGFLRLLEGFLIDEPGNDFLYARLLTLLERQGLAERALGLLRTRMRLKPGDADLRRSAVRLLEQMSRFAEARRVRDGALP